MIIHLTDYRVFPKFSNNLWKKKYYIQDEKRYTEEEREEEFKRKSSITIEWSEIPKKPNE